MKKDSIILITKDVLTKQYLPTYGRGFFPTPNIEELAGKGTVFQRHYTSAPSTAMAFVSMFTGLYPYQTSRKRYVKVDDMKDVRTLFDTFEEEGFRNHVAWTQNYYDKALPYSNCFGGSGTAFHTLANAAYHVGPHKSGQNSNGRDEKLAEASLRTVRETLDGIAQSDGSIFLWLHLPHVIAGRAGYGDDIDLLDKIVGYARAIFADDNIFISADHGSMNGVRGKCCYGFDVYEPAIAIPLITPRLAVGPEVDFPTSHRMLPEIIHRRQVPQEEFIVADSAYYAQALRKMAIIKGNFKYIYNKFTGEEELFDLNFDPSEQVNLLPGPHYDADRYTTYRKSEVCYYPDWDAVQRAYTELSGHKNDIWKTAGYWDEKISWLRLKTRVLLTKTKRLK